MRTRVPCTAIFDRTEIDELEEILSLHTAPYTVLIDRNGNSESNIFVHVYHRVSCVYNVHAACARVGVAIIKENVEYFFPQALSDFTVLLR